MIDTEVQPEPPSGDNVEENQNVDNTMIQPTDAPEESDTFSREYVEKLRQENGRYRQRAQRADDLAHRLHRALVAADGRLQDATDLDYADDHLDDDGSRLREAIDELLARKPHLAVRRPVGDIGQGATTSDSGVNLLGLLGGR